MILLFLITSIFRKEPFLLGPPDNDSALKAVARDETV